ncbi:MAG: translation elongation factor Ts [Patescibacteria group bacterium]|jgi:elongation factor Ts
MELIKQLREITGAGMVDCKTALIEAGNDLTKAVEILRKKGILKAAKRTGREAKEGVVKVAVNAAKTEAYILELNSETDFVSRNEKFVALADAILAVIIAQKPATLEVLLSLDLNGVSVQDALATLSGTIGENLAIKRLAIISGATVAAYSHLGGRLGVLVALDQPDQDMLAADIAMQIAAANPKYLLPAEVDPTEMAKEQEIYKEQLLKEGKPENMVEKIVAGKMGKYYSEVCLMEQEYIKDEKKKVKDILGAVNILKFVRYSL